jgi:hypothetical protein
MEEVKRWRGVPRWIWEGGDAVQSVFDEGFGRGGDVQAGYGHCLKSLSGADDTRLVSKADLDFLALLVATLILGNGVRTGIPSSQDWAQCFSIFLSSLA